MDSQYAYDLGYKVTGEQIIAEARKCYAKHSENNPEFTKADALVCVLENWDTGYDLTKSDCDYLESMI